jgi:hypothetical protein
MPGEEFHLESGQQSEQTPKYAEHVNDPTHPAGNVHLANEMAHAGKEYRDDVAEFNKKSAEILGQEGPISARDQQESKMLSEDIGIEEKNANEAEERTRTEYLAAHPELAQSSGTEKEGKQELSTDQAAEELGSAAVSDSALLENHPDLVLDPEKAHSMALASDASHENATKFRDDAKELAGQKISSKDEHDELATEVLRNLRRERYWENRADREEYWADIMHDHPPTDAYEHHHPVVGFNPRGMIYLEGLIKQEEEEIPRKQEELKGFDDDRWVAKNLSTYLERFQAGPRMTELMKNPDTTLADLKQECRRVIESSLGISKQYLEYNQGVLDDISSGRAAEYTGEES